jgi:hypothetical protein
MYMIRHYHQLQNPKIVSLGHFVDDLGHIFTHVPLESQPAILWIPDKITFFPYHAYTVDYNGIVKPSWRAYTPVGLDGIRLLGNSPSLNNPGSKRVPFIPQASLSVF